MKNVLIIYAHPSPNKSRVNRYLFSLANTFDHVKSRDLYELYPNWHIDVEAEQAALRDADVILFQFPIHWYSAPSILKEWQDTVLTAGFAYGEGDTVLKDKKFMLVVSCGGSMRSYNADGHHGAPLATYLTPFEQTARFCGMELLEPFVIQDSNALNSDELDSLMFQFGQRLREIGGLHGGN